MNPPDSDASPTGPPAAAAAVPPVPRPDVPGATAHGVRNAGTAGLLLALVLGAAGLLVGVALWQRLAAVQEQLARQSADSAAQSVEARTVARAAVELARETSARQAVMEARVSEVAMQRSQLEELMQSLSRSRDENLVVDIESAIRLAQQQAQLTGSVEPLVAALRSAEQRVTRAAQPRLTPLQRAIARDLGRVRTSTVSDTPALLVKLDELVRLADELPLANAVLPATSMATLKRQGPETLPVWWQRVLQVLGDEARNLVRVSRVEQPEAALLSPEQSFFVRENFKLKLLNARLGLLARQLEASRADLAAAGNALSKYFDASSRKTQSAAALLQQAGQQMRTLELPRVDDTLAALATAAAGR